MTVTFFVPLLMVSFVVSLMLVSRPALADLLPPEDADIRDSLSAVTEKGTELLKQVEYAGYRWSRPHFRASALLKWKTEHQDPEGDANRIRQDGRWYAGASRNVLAKSQWWVATQGERFEDRNLGEGSPGSDTRIQIMRAGSGVRTEALKRLKVRAAAGVVEDRRSDVTEHGLGVWTESALDDWNIGGYVQDTRLAYERETPKNHSGSIVAGSYLNTREYSPGNSNEASVSGSRIARDIFLEQTNSLSRRMDHHLEVRDILSYSAGSPLSVRLVGELVRNKTDQIPNSGPAITLEDNQAGFSASTETVYRRATMSLSAEFRTVTQTIRGDILQGNKTILGWAGSLRLPDKSTARLRLSVTKYALDTRSVQNNDDRDELKYSMESSWVKHISPTLRYELNAASRLDHLVYVESEYSANNRWTRLFALNSVMSYKPLRRMSHVIRTNIAANYQDYDFEFDERTTRSSVHRRLALSDSMTVNLDRRFSLIGTAMIQLEDFGRLFWESFEELRSDEVRARGFLGEVRANVGKHWKAGAGGVWDSRKNIRFDASKSPLASVQQHLRSYGPTSSLEFRPPSAVLVRIRARCVRQLQINQDPRWILSGDAIFAWQL